MPSPDTVQHRETSARRDCHYSAQRSDRMCSTAESPSAARIASCRCSWPGPPAIYSGRAIRGSNPPLQRTGKIPYPDTTFGKSQLSEPDSSDLNNVLGRLRHRHAAGEGNAAATGGGAEPDRGRIANYRPDVLERDVQHLRDHHRHRGARAADIGMAPRDGDRAVLVDVHRRTRFAAGIVPVARGNAASLVGLQRDLHVLAGTRGLQRLLIADIDPRNTVRRP